MLKNKFYKNFFQSLSCFITVIFLVLLLIIAYIESIKYGSDFGLILLLISLCMIILFFTIGFYWIFQKVIIDENGIKIIFINKIIKNFKWEEINTIEYANIMKNPALRIKLFNGSEIHLDKRKSIIRVIEKFSQKYIL